MKRVLWGFVVLIVGLWFVRAVLPSQASLCEVAGGR